MSKFLVTAIAAAAVLASIPAMAQMSSGSSMSSGNNMGSMDSMSCQQMIDNASGISTDSMDASKKAMMMKEMHMAKISMSAHHETNCKMHMQKAMGMM